MGYQTFSDKQTGLVTCPAPFSAHVEISSLTCLMDDVKASGKHNTTSYRLLKTPLSKLKEFEKLNKQDEKKSKQMSLF